MADRCNICGEVYQGLALDCRCTNYGAVPDPAAPLDLTPFYSRLEEADDMSGWFWRRSDCVADNDLRPLLAEIERLRAENERLELLVKTAAQFRAAQEDRHARQLEALRAVQTWQPYLCRVLNTIDQHFQVLRQVVHPQSVGYVDGQRTALKEDVKLVLPPAPEVP